MTGINESVGSTPLSDSLAVGIASISYDVEITFVRYIRCALPTDGTVYWVKASNVSTSGSQYNATTYNLKPFNQGGKPASGKLTTFNVKGSLHMSTQATQAEDGSPAVNNILFTTTTLVEEFNTIDPNTIWVGEFRGTQFGFRDRGNFYKQAGVWHYRGHAIYSIMDTQFLDNLGQLDTSDLIVSNSLPIWLSLYDVVPVYPSELVPINLTPPYATAHVIPELTEAIQPIPLLGPTRTHMQLATDTVRFTIYGLNNEQALDFQDYILSAALPDDGPFGLMGTPIMRDEKSTQLDFHILAQKKTFTIKVSYYQAQVRNQVRQLILSCTPNYIVSAAVS